MLGTALSFKTEWNHKFCKCLAIFIERISHLTPPHSRKEKLGTINQHGESCYVVSIDFSFPWCPLVCFSVVHRKSWVSQRSSQKRCIALCIVMTAFHCAALFFKIIYHLTSWWMFGLFPTVCCYKQSCHQHLYTWRVRMAVGGWGLAVGRHGWCTSQVGRDVNTKHATRQIQGVTQDKDKPVHLAWFGGCCYIPSQWVSFYPAAKALNHALGRQEGWVGSHLFFLFLAHALTSWRKKYHSCWCLRLDSLAKTLRQRIADRRLTGVCSQEMNL